MGEVSSSTPAPWRNDNFIRLQLRIITTSVRFHHGAKGNVNIRLKPQPMRHWLGTKIHRHCRPVAAGSPPAWQSENRGSVKYILTAHCFSGPRYLSVVLRDDQVPSEERTSKHALRVFRIVHP